MHNALTLGEFLGKTLVEVGEMSVSEFNLWMAYIKTYKQKSS